MASFNPLIVQRNIKPRRPQPLQIPKFATRSNAKCAIGLCCEEEIGLRQTFDLMSPDLNSAPAPRHVQLGVMPLLLGDVTDAIRKRHRGGEVAKLVGAKQMPGVREPPPGLELSE